jgi:predicted small lipoprotein YifL
MRCWPSYLLWLVIAVLGTGNMLVACGRSGDLYLPDKTGAPRDQNRPAIEDEDQSRVPDNRY